jgi:hypothetical protein
MKIWAGWSLILVLSFVIQTSGCTQKVSELPPLTKNASPPLVDDFSNLAKFSDNEITNWKLSSPVSIYDTKTIFDYIDGAAELYLAYGFAKVASAEYKNGQTSIMIDVYDMAIPENAFGVYSLNRYQEANYVSIGNEGILTDANLDFWKGNYYCKVYSFDPSEEYQKTVSEFGSKLASRIQDVGEEPAILKKLPQNGLIPKTAKFFTRKLGLDNIHFVSEDDLFSLTGNTKGVVADYTLNEGRFPLFIIEYPSQQKADLAFEAYTKYLNETSKAVPLEEASDGKAKMFESEGKFTFVSLKGQTLLGFWDVESQEVAKSALQYINLGSVIK